MKILFKAKIYKVGINWCVDVPARITKQMILEKGYIKVKGQINGFSFSKNLVPAKNKPYRLFVNLVMMKGAGTALGKVANFQIEQDFEKTIREYLVPDLLSAQLAKHKLAADFSKLTPARKKDILKYLHSIKTEETLAKNVDKVIRQLHAKEKNVRVP